MFDLPHKTKVRLSVVLILLFAFVAGNFCFSNYWNQAVEKVGFSGLKFEREFRLGLDLQGGAHLVYDADLSEIESGNESKAMAAVRDVIERRVNLYGVAEPDVRTEKTKNAHRLVVELAGVKDVSKAIDMIGKTPQLDFRLLKSDKSREDITAMRSQESEKTDWSKLFNRTDLDGRLLEGAKLSFGRTAGKPQVTLNFNSKGSDLFAKITGENVDNILAIFLDGKPISTPNINEKIPNGKAAISGNFSTDEAKKLVKRLNAGALPVPISLASQHTVGASLGKLSLGASVKAALWGLLVVVLFLVVYYRVPGLAAVVGLTVYGAIVLALYKFIPVTLTLSGVAGFILSLGMAVDANVLIFERLKEELSEGRDLNVAVEEGFARAWPSIRDGNISTIITATILYFIGVGFVQGFALTLGIGVAISMFTAVFFTRRLLDLIAETSLQERKSWFSSKVAKVEEQEN